MARILQTRDSHKIREIMRITGINGLPVGKIVALRLLRDAGLPHIQQDNRRHRRGWF
jgi:hypothetical protein